MNKGLASMIAKSKAKGALAKKGPEALIKPGQPKPAKEKGKLSDPINKHGKQKPGNLATQPPMGEDPSTDGQDQEMPEVARGGKRFGGGKA